MLQLVQLINGYDATTIRYQTVKHESRGLKTRKVKILMLGSIPRSNRNADFTDYPYWSTELDTPFNFICFE